ncbi:DUF2065 family protein [Rubellimicrobium sp. CFH 75288]|uniref:DUF2065 family protein n=1 Tax=Rubellimicrobium sp. CFH 75288 TaxID=2697034 RepID=UPI00141280BB|nr:DUF2065 family protein [Rubellimicrobium sp. CFH 75288]
MAWALLAIGLVLLVEGLLWALAPRLVEEMLAALRTLPPETRRLVGLGAAALGLALVWAAWGLGALTLS